MEGARETLEDLKEIIKDALRRNDSQTVDYYHLFTQQIESSCMIVYLNQQNKPELAPIISYLQDKVNYIKRELTKYNES